MESGFNIIEEHLIDTELADADFVSSRGFFFHSTVGGVVKYLPLGNTTEAITKTIEASDDFNRCTQCKRIYKVDTTATGIYIGYPR